MQFDQSTRREFIALLCGAAAWPLAARAQQPAIPVIGFLNSASPEAFASYIDAFLIGLNETGFVEGRNLPSSIVVHEGRYAQLPSLAADPSTTRSP